MDEQDDQVARSTNRSPDRLPRPPEDREILERLKNLAIRHAHDQQIGVNVVKRAIEEPTRWIAINAGQEGSIVVQNVRELKDEEGFNALVCDIPEEKKEGPMPGGGGMGGMY